MCGIYLTNIPYKKDEVNNKLDSIRYRGPDNKQVARIDGIIMGHLRLSVIDLDEHANQPMKFENLQIVYNGEIYNYLDIKKELEALGCQFTTKSDTEVLLQGYQMWGKNILNRLNGMFSFCIYDSNENKIFAARDRLGQKPFYYYWKDGDFEICSQLRPLINRNSKISKKAISIYLDCGYVPSPYSILEDVYKLPPGNFMEIGLHTKTRSIKEFWNLHPVKTKDISYKDAKEELHELLIDAVKIRLQSDVPLGTFLSGGIDSALVSSIAARYLDRSLKTFTIGFEDPKFDESKRAEEFAKIIGSEHTTTICTPSNVLDMLPKLIEVYDEPFADSSALPSLLLNSITKPYVTVALSGDGGDESFLGYYHFEWVKKFQTLEVIPYAIRRMISGFGWHRILSQGKPETIKNILSTRDGNSFARTLLLGFTSIQEKRNLRWFDKYYQYSYLTSNPIQQAADLFIKLTLENDFNVKVDRASMASSMEVRSPFQDYRVVEFARDLPIKYRFKNGNKKRILKDLLKEYIPENIFNTPKSGFSIPLADWIRHELKEEILSELNNDFLEWVPNLNVQKFRRQLDEHMEASYNYHPNIWRVYILAKWLKEFNLELV